jgi:hypothetical protein
MQIENVLIRLRETTWEINEAKADDPRRRVTLEKTWVLQDRLAMPEQVRCHWSSRLTRY